MTAQTVAAYMPSRPVLLMICAGIFVCAAFALMAYEFHLHEEDLRAWLSGFFEMARGTPWALPLVLALYVALGLVCFPISVLNIACAMVFGLWGVAYGLAGSILSTFVTFGVGRLLHERLGKKALRFSRIKAADEALRKGGVAAAAATHLVPVLPFSAINMVAGLSSARALPYLAGSIIVLLPGCLARGVLGDSLGRVLLNPTPETWLYVGAGVVLLALTLAGAHVAVKKLNP